MAGPPAVVFTDLDGTLLDLASYEAGPAAAALAMLLDVGIPVFFCSSKTRAEQTAIAASLGVEVGMIVENGGAVAEPGGDERVFGVPYDEVRSGLAVAAVAAAAQVRGYGDMALDEVMRITGLDESAARRARLREYSETFLLESGTISSLRSTLAERGLRVVRGARFWTAQGAHDKGTAIRHLMSGSAVESFALGDFDNDLEMLAAVDRPMLVQRPDGTWRDLSVPGLVRLNGVGPEGWCAGAELILRRLSM